MSLNQSPEYRAEVIAGIRALAEFLEANPQLPVPDGVDGQFSILGDFAEDHRAEVRRIAESIGADLRHDRPDLLMLWHEIASGGSAEAGYWHTRYIIHGRRDTKDGAS